MSRTSHISPVTSRPVRGLPAVSYLSGVLLVLSAGIFWSVIPLGVRQFNQAGIWQILLYRSLGLLPMIFALIALQTRAAPVQAIRAVGISGFIGAAGLVAAYAGGIAAVRLTSIANAAFLFATAPFLAALIGKLILKESIRTPTYIAMTIALIGITVMVFNSFTQGNWLGDVVALLSAVGFAVFTIALRAGKERNTLPVVLLGALFSVMLSAGIVYFSNLPLNIPADELLLGLGLGACVLGTGMVFYTLGSRVVAAAELALLSMTEVVLAPVWAWMFLHEMPVPGVLAGGAIVILAIVFNALSGIRRKPQPVTF